MPYLGSKNKDCKFGAGCKYKGTTCTFAHPDMMGAPNMGNQAFGFEG